MPETTAQLPARTNRLQQTLVDEGFKPQSAYTLSEEVRTMVADKIEREVAGLKTAVSDRLDLHESRIEDFKTGVNDRLDLHESRFEAFKTSVNDRLDLHESRFEDFKTGVNDRFNRHESRLENFTSKVNDRLDLHDGKIGALEGTVAALDGKVAALDSKVEDLKTIVNRWFDSQAVSLNLMAEGQNRLERRMETQLDRVVTTHIRMTWAIIGSAAFAGLCFVVGWLWKMLGG
ncbi:MAG: hypothetical protein OXB91_09760 [Bryobacterales bacterium]|nr:hypothetical protein [Bryobacterales bacterium]